VSAGEWAGLIAALALVLLVVLLAIPLLKLGRVLDETTLTIRQTREQAGPILVQAGTTVAHVNSNATLGGPLIKMAAFSYGVRSAVRKKREGEAVADLQRRDRDARRARKAARRAA
jgi:hypothetical protein